jgi:hypothetical protein
MRHFTGARAHANHALHLHHGVMHVVRGPSSQIPEARAPAAHPSSASGERIRTEVAASEGTETTHSFRRLVGCLQSEGRTAEEKRSNSSTSQRETQFTNTHLERTKGTFLKNFMYIRTPTPPSTIGDRI